MRPLLAASLSLRRARVRASEPPLALFLTSLSVLPARVNTHVHSFRLCPTSARIAGIPPFRSHLSLSLSHSLDTPVSFSASPFFLARFLSLSFSPRPPSAPSATAARATGHVAPTRSPFFTPRHLFPFLLPTLLPPIRHIRSAVNAVTYARVAQAQAFKRSQGAVLIYMMMNEDVPYRRLDFNNSSNDPYFSSYVKTNDSENTSRRRRDG